MNKINIFFFYKNHTENSRNIRLINNQVPVEFPKYTQLHVEWNKIEPLHTSQLIRYKTIFVGEWPQLPRNLNSKWKKKKKRYLS